MIVLCVSSTVPQVNKSRAKVPFSVQQVQDERFYNHAYSNIAFIVRPEIDTGSNHAKKNNFARHRYKGANEMKAIDRILDEIKNHKSELCKEYPIKKIGVFGSYLRGEERSDSDVDVLVEFGQPIDLFRFLDLEEKLSELFGKKVDLVSKKALKPHIGRQILKEVRYL